jgi:predicted GIY-YIG superfamily endonuclease
VASDQNTSIMDPEVDQADSVIPNQLPAYRAISPLAVCSLFFGILASFSFAHSFFYVFAILAVAMGILAIRAIQHYPDMLTGSSLAKAGITLGLMFGLISATYTGVQTFVRTRAAESFSRKFAELLKSPSESDVVWYTVHPQQRKDKTPAQVLKEFDSSKAKERMMAEQRHGELRKLWKRLTSSTGEEIHFVKIQDLGLDESHGADVTFFAVALFEVEGPGNAEFPEKHQYAAAVLKGTAKGRHYEWWVEEVKYPYNLQTIAPTVKPADDGHGHAH